MSSARRTIPGPVRSACRGGWPSPRAGTAARVCVVIEFHDASDGYFGTVGVDENIIHASWQALTDAIEYKLLNQAEKRTKR